MSGEGGTTEFVFEEENSISFGSLPQIVEEEETKIPSQSCDDFGQLTKEEVDFVRGLAISGEMEPLFARYVDVRRNPRPSVAADPPPKNQKEKFLLVVGRFRLFWIRRKNKKTLEVHKTANILEEISQICTYIGDEPEALIVGHDFLLDILDVFSLQVCAAIFAAAKLIHTEDKLPLSYVSKDGAVQEPIKHSGYQKFRPIAPYCGNFFDAYLSACDFLEVEPWQNMLEYLIDREARHSRILDIDIMGSAIQIPDVEAFMLAMHHNNYFESFEIRKQAVFDENIDLSFKLGDMIGKNRTLRRIVFSNQYITNEGAGHIIQSISNFKESKLRELDFSFCNMYLGANTKHPHPALEQICGFVSSFQTGITSLSLRGVGLTARGGKDLCNAFFASRSFADTVVSLDLSHNPSLSSEELVRMFQGLAHFHNLKNLALGYCRIPADDVLAILNCTKGTVHLEKLDISGACMGGNPHILQAFTSTLRELKDLVYLCVNDCNLGSNLSTVISSFCEGKKDVVLKCDGNYVLHEGFKDVCAALESNTNIKSLSIARNMLGNRGVAAVANALMANDTLEFLDISANVSIMKLREEDFSRATVNAITHLITSKPNLHTFIMRGDMLANLCSGADLVSGLAAIIPHKDFKLKYLDISENGAGPSAMVSLFCALEMNTSIEYIAMDNNMADIKAFFAMRAMMNHNNTLLHLCFPILDIRRMYLKSQNKVEQRNRMLVCQTTAASVTKKLKMNMQARKRTGAMIYELVNQFRWPNFSSDPTYISSVFVTKSVKSYGKDDAVVKSPSQEFGGLPTVSTQQKKVIGRPDNRRSFGSRFDGSSDSESSSPSSDDDDATASRPPENPPVPVDSMPQSYSHTSPQMVAAYQGTNFSITASGTQISNQGGMNIMIPKPAERTPARRRIPGRTNRSAIRMPNNVVLAENPTSEEFKIPSIDTSLYGPSTQGGGYYSSSSSSYSSASESETDSWSSSPSPASTPRKYYSEDEDTVDTVAVVPEEESYEEIAERGPQTPGLLSTPSQSPEPVLEEVAESHAEDSFDEVVETPACITQEEGFKEQEEPSEATSDAVSVEESEVVEERSTQEEEAPPQPMPRPVSPKPASAGTPRPAQSLGLRIPKRGSGEGSPLQRTAPSKPTPPGRAPFSVPPRPTHTPPPCDPNAPRRTLPHIPRPAAPPVAAVARGKPVPRPLGMTSNIEKVRPPPPSGVRPRTLPNEKPAAIPKAPALAERVPPRPVPRPQDEQPTQSHMPPQAPARALPRPGIPKPPTQENKSASAPPPFSRPARPPQKVIPPAPPAEGKTLSPVGRQTTGSQSSQPPMRIPPTARSPQSSHEGPRRNNSEPALRAPARRIPAAPMPTEEPPPMPSPTTPVMPADGFTENSSAVNFNIQASATTNLAMRSQRRRLQRGTMIPQKKSPLAFNPSQRWSPETMYPM